MSLLPSLSLDVFGYLCERLCGKSIALLRGCGNKALTSRLDMTAKSFRQKMQPFMKFPFSAFDQPLLREISVRLEYRYFFSPLTCGGRVPLPSKPIPTLVKLSLNFFQSSSILDDTERFCSLFPNLTDLSLSGGRESINADALERLPKMLRRLKIKNEYQDLLAKRKPLITLSSLSKISQNLEILQLIGYCIGTPQDDEECDFCYSETIVDLWLSDVVAPKLASTFPRFSTRVELNLALKNPISKSISVSVFPHTLKNLIVNDVKTRVTYVLDGPLPAGLEECDVCMDWVDFKHRRVSPFVQSSALKVLNCTAEFLGASLEYCPKSLTDLEITEDGVNKQLLDALPPTLTRLTIETLPVELFSLIPSTIEQFILTDLVGEGRIPKSEWERLKRLSVLAVALHVFESASCFSALGSLEKLSLTVTGNNHLADQKKLFSFLPGSKLTGINLYLMNTGNSWPYWLSQLQQCHQLTSLICQAEMDDGCDVLPTFLTQLPPSITELRVPLYARSGIDEHPELMHALPTSLEFLYLENSLNLAKLSDEHFAKLPKALHAIRFPNAEDMNLTEKFWHLIPATLADTDVGAAHLEWAREYRKRNLHLWEGYKQYPGFYSTE